MIFPIHGSVLPRPGSVRDYLYQRTTKHKHRGLDFAAPKGTPVLAVESGTIATVIRESTIGFRGYGRVVVLLGDSGRFFLYAHLDRVLVSEGEMVLIGAPLGTVGTSVFSRDNPTLEMRSAPHLHFEVSKTRYPKNAESPRIDPRVALRSATHLENGRRMSMPPTKKFPKKKVVSAIGVIIATILWWFFKKIN